MKDNKIEGAMGILQGDRTPSGKANYRIFFVPYSKRIEPLCGLTLGDDALEQYLLKAGLEGDVAKGWLKALRTANSVSIDNVFLSEEFLRLQCRQLRERRRRPNFLWAFLHTLRLVPKAEVNQ